MNREETVNYLKNREELKETLEDLRKMLNADNFGYHIDPYFGGTFNFHVSFYWCNTEKEEIRDGRKTEAHTEK